MSECSATYLIYSRKEEKEEKNPEKQKQKDWITYQTCETFQELVPAHQSVQNHAHSPFVNST